MLILLYKKGFGQPYYETKFVLPVEAGPVLAAFLRRVYPSRSPYWQSKLTTTYYDDLALGSYWESRDGLLNKMKYRFRQYFNPSGVGADYGIEIKRREGPLVNKTKILLKAAGTGLSPMADFGSLLDRLRSVPGASAAALRTHVRQCLRPTLAISCERLRFVNQRAQERYSLDQHIACVAMPGLSGWRRRRVPFPYTIFEIKSAAAVPAAPFLRMFALEPVSFSKYAYGISALLEEADRDGKYQ